MKGAIVQSISLMFAVGVLVLVQVPDAHLQSCTEPTIYCTNFTVGCNGLLYDLFTPDEWYSIAQIAASEGCWCQNKGCGAAPGTPGCPAWLTCPNPPGILVSLIYGIQANFLCNNNCHCQCNYNECSPDTQYNLPPP